MPSRMNGLQIRPGAAHMGHDFRDFFYIEVIPVKRLSTTCVGFIERFEKQQSTTNRKQTKQTKKHWMIRIQAVHMSR
jgi:hypothetical protein